MTYFNEYELQRSREFIKEMMARLEALEAQPEFKRLWQGRPRQKPIRPYGYFLGSRVGGRNYIPIGPPYAEIDWTGCLTAPWFDHVGKGDKK